MTDISAKRRMNIEGLAQLLLFVVPFIVRLWAIEGAGNHRATI
jgi:hypothetical protein